MDNASFAANEGVEWEVQNELDRVGCSSVWPGIDGPFKCGLARIAEEE
jgi:hypothetical protein